MARIIIEQFVLLRRIFYGRGIVSGMCQRFHITAKVIFNCVDGAWTENSVPAADLGLP